VNRSIEVALLIGVVAFGVGAVIAAERSAHDDIPYAKHVPTNEEIQGWVERICTQGIRRGGHPADLWIEQFVAGQFEKWGLQGISFQPVPLTAWFEGDTAFTLKLADGRLFDVNAYPMANMDLTKTVTAPVVRVRSEADLNDIEGTIVVVDQPVRIVSPTGVLYMLPAASFVWDPDRDLLDTSHISATQDTARPEVGMRRILEHKPAAVVGVLTNYYESPYYFGGSRGMARTGTPGVFITAGDGQHIDEYLAEGPVTGTLELNGSSKPVITHNVKGTLPGATDELVIVASHKDGPFYGATEDAAGIALMLAQAKYWAKVPAEQRPHTMLFLATASHLPPIGELEGSTGERTIIRENPDVLKRTVLDVHLETPALEYRIDEDGGLVNMRRPEPRRLFTSMAPQLERAVIEAVKAEDLRRTMVLPADVLEHPRSAAGHFHSAGVPIVSFISLPVYYFAAEDTPDKVDREGLSPITRTFIRIIYETEGATAAGMRAASDDLSQEGYEVVKRRFRRGGPPMSERAKAYRAYLMSFDSDGDGDLDEAENAALRKALEERLYQ
jgi:hypothetical protein